MTTQEVEAHIDVLEKFGINVSSCGKLYLNSKGLMSLFKYSDLKVIEDCEDLEGYKWVEAKTEQFTYRSIFSIHELEAFEKGCEKLEH